MSVEAVIRFQQPGAPGGTIDGRAREGVLGNLVTCTAAGYGSTPIGYEWSFIDVPAGSANGIGVFAFGTAVSTFTPDVTGGYMVQLKVFDASGNSATQRLAFLVPEASGRFIPPFSGDPASLNVNDSTKGWHPYLVTWLKYLDTVSGGGGGGSPWTSTPIDVDPSGSSGASPLFARGDHVHGFAPATMQSIASSASTGWDFNGQKLGFLGAPTLANDAIRKVELDNFKLADLKHDPVRLIETTTNLSLNGFAVADGTVVNNGDRVAAAAQANPVENGPWVAAAGAWTRPADWANGRVLNGDFFFVTEGATYANQGVIVVTDSSPIVGTTPIQLDFFTLQTPTLVGDCSGPTGNNVVTSLHGDSMSNMLSVYANKTVDTSNPGIRTDTIIQGSTTTSMAVPSTPLTHYFSYAFGGATAVLQVDVCDSAGNVESFWYRETRSYQGAGTPTLVGTVKSELAPAVPTHTVTMVWSSGNVAVQVTPATSADTRFAIKLHVYEVNQP